MNSTKSLKELLGFDLNFNYSTMGDLRQSSNYNGNDVIWGLNSKGNPPILIYPRPKIRLKSVNGDAGVFYYNVQDGEETIFTEAHDFVMQRCIEREKPEDIIEAMFDGSIVFEYNDV